MKAWITFNQRSTRHYTRCAKALYRGWIRRFAKRRCSRHCSASSDIFLQYVDIAHSLHEQWVPRPADWPTATGKTPPTPSHFLQLRWPYSSAEHWSYVPLQTQANPLLQISFYAQHLCSADSCVALFSVPEALPESP